eukprot:s782_g8.t1
MTCSSPADSCCSNGCCAEHCGQLPRSVACTLHCKAQSQPRALRRRQTESASVCASTHCQFSGCQGKVMSSCSNRCCRSHCSQLPQGLPCPLHRKVPSAPDKAEALQSNETALWRRLRPRLCGRCCVRRKPS